MIIDIILDRYTRHEYNAKQFYNEIMAWLPLNEHAHGITLAMDYGSEKDIKKSLCDYVLSGEYNPNICTLINNSDWLTDCKQDIIRVNDGENYIDGYYQDPVQLKAMLYDETHGTIYKIISISENGSCECEIVDKF